MPYNSIRVERNRDRSYMDSTPPVAKTKRFETYAYADAPLTDATERFYGSNNVQYSRSPYGWKKRVGIKGRWPSTFSLDVSGDAPVLWWDILWTPSKFICKRRIIGIQSTRATGTAFERCLPRNRYLYKTRN